MNRFHFSWLVGLFVATSTGCDRTVPVGSMDGTTCSDVGATKSQNDGCNTCTCGADHTWSCTGRDCQCTPGTTKLADDGCNSCSCGADGNWACTLMACSGAGGTTGSGGASATGGSTGTQTVCCVAAPVCNEGDTQLSTVGPVPCPSNTTCYSNSICCSTVWCMKTNTTCTALPVCDAGDTQIDGICPPDGSCYGRSLCGTTINCQETSIVCTSGSTKVADDGCNKCICAEGRWSCEEIYCPLCTPGSTKVASDGCNDCTCSADGVWGCTQRYCSAEACTAGKAQYQDFRNELLAKYGPIGCTTDSGCSLVHESNRCIANCGTAVATTMASSFSSNLAAAAETYCTSCSAMAVPPCLPLVARCVNGACVTGSAIPE